MQEEVYNSRDRSYSAWHRRASTRRFIAFDDAQLLAMIDLDASLYIEYDDGTKEPLALIETAKDVGQPFKTATVTLNLAKRADLPCFVVLYRTSDKRNPADTKWPDIDQFRVKQLYPREDKEWQTYAPYRWAQILLGWRRWTGKNLDKEYRASLREECY